MVALTAYQRHMKRELKGKMKGKTKAQRIAIFKAAARKWKKKPKSSSRSGSSSSRRVSSASTSTRSTASSSGSPSRRTKMRSFLNFNSLKGWIQKIALIAPAVGVALNPAIQGPHEKIRYGILTYTGFDLANPSVFRWDFLIQGWTPYLASVAITEGVTLLKRIIKGFR